MGRKHSSYALVIEVLLFQSKLSIMAGNANKTNNLLAEAKSVGIEKGISHLITKIQTHHEFLTNEVAKWTSLADKHSMFQNRFEILEMEKYIATAAQMIQGQMEPQIIQKG